MNEPQGIWGEREHILKHRDMERRALSGDSIHLRLDASNDPVTGALEILLDATIHGLTVGKGGSAIASNTAVGVNALLDTIDGYFNTAIGHSASRDYIGGVGNTSVGCASQMAGVSGNANTSVGSESLLGNHTGGGNTAIGANALSSAEGSNNTGVGCSALSALTGNHESNVAMGHSAGARMVSADKCVFIGGEAGGNRSVQADGLTNSIAIGYGVNTTKDNQVIIGNADITETILRGIVETTGDRLRIDETHTPSSAGDTGTTGDICWDANYLYICVATNTWKRVGIATW
jgi:hypothetical protein